MTKRTILRKIRNEPANGEGVDALVADVLSVPVSAEDELLSAVRKSGADDSVEVVAIAARRALTALAKAYRDAGRPVPIDVAKALAGDDSVDDGPPPGAWTTYDARRDIIEENAEKRKRKTKKKPTEDEDNAEATQFGSLSKEDAASLLDAIKDVLPEWAADRVQKEHPDWTREQARSHAYTQDPSLYRREQERQAARLEKADATARVRAARSDRELRGLVADIRKAEPGLSEPQAWKRALDQRPDLYVPTPTPRYDPADAVIAKAERDAAHARYERLAEEIRKSDPSLTAAQAYARAMQLRPDWYTG